jgi:glycosyltransferase involved in cell wall biosynthesis
MAERARTVIPDLVSVIVPVYNRERFLREAVDCVYAQTYRPIELVLVDDGSTDGTRDMCDHLSAERPDMIRVANRPNGGPGAARETGRLVARGEVIQYLDSDDWIAPTKLERQVAALRERPEADVCYCITAEEGPGAKSGRAVSARTGENLERLFPDLLAGRCWQTVSPLWRRSLTDRIGPWTALRQEEDWEYDARAAALGADLIWLPERLAVYRHHEYPRAAHEWRRDPERMRDRVRAHTLIYSHAREAEIGPDEPCMQRFSRALFLLSRQCGAAGLPAESHSLFALAREAAGSVRGGRADFRGYEIAARLLGWGRAGWIACQADRLRGGEAAEAGTR